MPNYLTNNWKQNLQLAKSTEENLRKENKPEVEGLPMKRSGMLVNQSIKLYLTRVILNS